MSDISHLQITVKRCLLMLCTQSFKGLDVSVRESEKG